MNENEKRIFENLAENLDSLPEIKQGEFIGYAKCMADLKRSKLQEDQYGVKEEKKVG